MQGIRRVIAVSAVAVAGLFGLAASPAMASTPGCVANGFCGDQQNFHDGLVFDVFQQKAASNNKVIAYFNTGSDRATDFINYHPSSGPGANTASVKAFEYAPNGSPSGFCLSDPGPGFGAMDLIVLRPCNSSKFQIWTPIASTDHSGWFSWRNWATNQFVTDNGIRGQLTDIKDGHVGDPDNNQPSQDVSQLWQFVQQPVVTTAYGPLGGLSPCTATSITCKGDTPPPSPWKLTAAVSFQATNISGGWTFRTNATVTTGEHLVCAGHPTNVTSVSGSTFGVSPRVPVAGGAVVTCLVN